jgi:hypothetical protein
LDKIFTHGIVEKNFKCQDIFILFASVNASTNSAAQRYIWDFFKNNLSLFMKLFDPTSSLFQKCLLWSADHFCTSSDADEFQVFFTNFMIVMSKFYIEILQIKLY